MVLTKQVLKSNHSKRKRRRLLTSPGVPQTFKFFFPALPDKCETWSVNNWKEPVIEIKFPQRKKPTTNPTKQQNKQHPHTSQGTSQAKHSGKFAN